MRVKCRQYEGDLVELYEVDAIYDMGLSRYFCTYRLVIRINHGENIEIAKAYANEIEVINAKDAD